MDPATAAAIASAGSKVGDGIFGFLGARKQRKHHERMVKRAEQHSLDMWRLQADYNNPANQMERLKDAGLNPHLVYGQPSANVAGSMNTKPDTELGHTFENELAHLQLPNVLGLLQSVQQFKNKKEEQKILQQTQEKHPHILHQEEMKSNKLWNENFKLIQSIEANIEKAKQEAIQAKTRSQTMKYEQEIKKYEAQLAKELKQLNMTPSDHVGIRALIKLMNVMGIKLQ